MLDNSDKVIQKKLEFLQKKNQRKTKEINLVFITTKKHKISIKYVN
jgi:hypothetical protein